MPLKLIIPALVGFVLIVLSLNSLFIVRETDQAMVLALGRVERIVTEPGLHFKIPFYQQILFFDKRVLETDSSPEEVQTVDKKRVVVDSFTRWRITDIEEFYKKVNNTNNAITRLNTIVNSNIRRTLARSTLQDLVTDKRDELMAEIQSESGREAKEFGIEIVDVRIKRADLPAENSRAIFRRMRTEREKEAREIRANGDEEAQKIRADADKQRTILLAEAERDAQSLRGQGDAEGIRITGRAFGQDPEFYRFQRSLEAYRSSLQSGTTFVLDPSMSFMDVLQGNN